MKCCICTNDIEVSNAYWGHNPYPITESDHKVVDYKTFMADDDKERCCVDCNQKVVLPARLAHKRGCRSITVDAPLP